MKQLKFMLAAATAVGIAAVAQAASTTTSYLVGTENTPENFDADNLQGKNPVGSMAGYSFEPTAPATASDNESVVTNQVLNVNTGTDPLFRHLNDKVGTAVDLTTVESLYIDTMVQFTVTPAGDTVTPADGDKLMIYLAEVTNDTGVVTGTNLMVKAAGWNGEDEAFAAADYAIANDVEPGEWYNLKVVAKVLGEEGTYFPCFSIYLGKAGTDPVLITRGGVEVPTFDDYDDAGECFPSMALVGGSEGIKSATLTYVGFAGEGKIDDLTVATITTVDSVDFTFTFIGDYLSSVTYTIGTDTETTYQWSVGETEELDDAGTIKIKSIAFSDLYTVATDSKVKVGDTLTVDAADMEFPITAKALTGDSDAKVPANTKPADIGIESTTGIPATVPSTKLDSMIKWATANKGAGKETIDVINEMAFDQNGNPKVDGATTNVAAQAYLLNCAIADVPVVEKAFKFDTLTFTANGLPDLAGIAKAWGTGDSAKLFNGEPVLDYKAKLTDAWGVPPASLTDEESKAGFFRARLVLDDGIN